VVIFLFLAFSGTGQGNSYSKKTKPITISKLDFVKPTNENISITENLSYSLSLSNWLYVNEPHQYNNLILLQVADYSSHLRYNSKYSLITEIHHELGFQYLFDSIIIKSADRNTMKNSIKLLILNDISLDYTSTVETQFMNGFSFITDDSLGVQKNISSTFLTPFYCRFSFGLDYNNKKIGILKLGISSAKLTYLHNSVIFESTGKSTLFGVSKSQKILFEYGLSSSLKFDQNIGKKIQWKCDIQAFKNFEFPVDLDITNILSLKANKYFKTSIRTRFLYNEHISKTFRLENTVTVGFYFEL